jgi:deoxyribonuclease-4
VATRSGPAVGSHVGLRTALADAATTRSQGVVQVFASSPRMWAPPKDVDLAPLHAAGLRVFLHAPYLINVASPDAEVRRRSAASLRATLDVADVQGAAGVVVHGGHAGADAPEGAGFARWAALLARLEADTPLLIENTAGGANACARTLAQLERLYGETIPGAGAGLPVGFCLDTCHAWAGDAAFSTDAGLARLLAVTGTPALVHVNGSRDPRASGRDRHANVGEGELSTRTLARMLRTLRDAGCDAFVVETPWPPERAGEDVVWVRRTLAR